MSRPILPSARKVVVQALRDAGYADDSLLPHRLSLGQTHLCLTQLDDDLFCRKPLPCHPCILPKPKILTFTLDSF